MDALVAAENGFACPWGQVLGITICTVITETEMQEAKLGVSRVAENKQLLSCHKVTRQLNSQENTEITANLREDERDFLNSGQSLKKGHI